MRLKCEVQVTSRQLPSLNIRKPNRPNFSQVSIGRKPGECNKDGPIYLMLCTSQNRSGTKYLIPNNLVQIFSRFVSEGKATLRIQTPPDDVSLSKADPAQLQSFLKLLKMAADGKEFPERVLSPLVPAATAQVTRPVTNLIIDSPSNYPMSFPTTLQKLAIQHCSLRRLSLKVTALTSLSVLDLSYNNLTELPESFAALRNLTYLDLAHNSFEEFPSVLASDTFCKNLVLLDMKDNEMRTLSPEFTKLSVLQSINLNCNRLRYLPERLGLMPRLSSIHVSNNLLELLPCTLVTRIFHKADFSDNPFTLTLPPGAYLNQKQRVPSLREAAGQAVLLYDIPYTEEDLDFVSREFLESGHYCTCGRVVFRSAASDILTHTLNAVVHCGNDDLPFLFYCCSTALITPRSYICQRRMRTHFWGMPV
ncbi:leucine-rich repeat protein 1-like [Plakobranchus ocellatus]|uniref:Leucine-rich repeat protein 1-like n=1 Tax=Plakobranchus ocellatus TaxID=259542 RepID=A0AAV4CE37_9GAST|nr:leucine-rich repeat protein 1-like [Plakobranchus ocellatus]